MMRCRLVGLERDREEKPGLRVQKIAAVGVHLRKDGVCFANVRVQHQGLGRLLLLRLIAAASERGIRRFRCELLGTNTRMAALLAQISPDRSIDVGAGVMSIEIELPWVGPTEPETAAPVQSSIYRLLRAAAQNALEWTDAVRRLWRR